MLKKILQSTKNIYYWPNPGNLGDLLIAEATRQYFRREGIIFREYNPDTPPSNNTPYILILGGGGLSSHWGGDDLFCKHLTAPHVQQGIILAHSFYGVDSLIQAMDSRHTLICREEASFNYCKSLNSQSSIIMGDDMAFLWNPHAETNTSKVDYTEITEEKQQKIILKGAWKKRIINGVKLSTVISNKKKIAFLLRKDKEKNTLLTSSYSYDISLAYGASCRETKYTAQFIEAFSTAINYPDIIVTDRLHVGIMGYLLGKEVYLLDNDYGKLSGVYHYSLKDAPNVHMLHQGVLTPELKKAWDLFNDERANLKPIHQEPEFQILQQIKKLKRKHKKAAIFAYILPGKYYHKRKEKLSNIIRMLTADLDAMRQNKRTTNE